MSPSKEDRARWYDYLLLRGRNVDDHFATMRPRRARGVLLVVGHGHDPRMALGARRLQSALEGLPIKCMLFDYSSTGRDYGTIEKGADKNLDAMRAIPNMTILPVRIPKIDQQGKRISSVSVHKALLENEAILSEIDTVVVDVSAMPRDVFLTAIAQLLHIHRRRSHGVGSAFDLYVLTSEDPAIDKATRPTGVENDVTYLQGFEGGRSETATDEAPRIWLPVLGEDRREHLRRLHSDLSPDEICPLVPFPTREPRRGDDIIKEYRGILFDEFGVTPRNVLYAAEDNPFQVYREIRRTALDYINALRPVGTAKVFISPLSSKLLSIGALLATYELKYDLKIQHVGIPHIPASDHERISEEEVHSETALTSIWIAGQAYA